MDHWFQVQFYWLVVRLEHWTILGVVARLKRKLTLRLNVAPRQTIDALTQHPDEWWVVRTLRLDASGHQVLLPILDTLSNHHHCHNSRVRK